jgi:hypothetical protein
MPAPVVEPTCPSARVGGVRRKFAALAVLAVVGTVVVPVAISGAATAVGLGTASSFAVVGSGTVTNTGPTVLDGDLGVHPGNALTGFAESDGGPGIVNGALHAGDETAAAAQAAADTAYGALDAQACDANLTDPELGGLTLTPGVYCFSSSAQLTGALTLDAVGDPDAVFIFRVASALTTASDSSVVFLDDFASCGVFWQVGSAATLGTDTDFVGTLIAQTEAITANTGATVMGRLLALNAAVTLDSNVITTTVCDSTDEPPVDEPVDGEPVDGEPVDGEPVDESPTGEVTDTGSPVGGPTDVSGPFAGGPRTPATGGPPAVTGGPEVPAPTLPPTGANIVLAGLALMVMGLGFWLLSLEERRPTPCVAGGSRFSRR